MDAPIFFVPGQQIRHFAVFRRGSTQDRIGRVVRTSQEAVGHICGTLSETTQREVQKWHQLGHPVTHKIMIHGKNRAKAMDILIDRHDCAFEVSGVEDACDLGFFHTVYCKQIKGKGGVLSGENHSDCT